MAMKNRKENEIMTVKQVAEYLQMDEHTIYKLSRSGLIPSVKIAGQWRFKKEIIDKWIAEKSLERIEILNSPLVS
jgi:excisionase family DNA binding protein